MAQDSPPVDTIIQDVERIKLGSVEGGIEKENKGDSDDSDAEGVDGTEPGGSTSANKKKKKKKPKKKKVANRSPDAGNIPTEEPAPAPETDDDRQDRMALLESGPERLEIPLYGILEERVRSRLLTFLTPSCRKFELLTPRLRLRQVSFEDTTGIRKIKMEPVVQKTQLYGSPSFSDIKESFQTRYIRSSIPRISPSSAPCRDEYVFAVTARDPASLVIGPPGQIKITNRVNGTEGYLGNIALRLEADQAGPSLLPQAKTTYIHPTFDQTTEVSLIGKVFYEIHPQLWGQGLMSEAFGETLRFAFEEVGCNVVEADPTSSNMASIKVCTKHGMKHTHTGVDNPYGKPQAYHSITRGEWWKRNRPGREITDHWGGKEVCRWCLNFRLAAPTINCHRCDWAKYCSKECQWADWVDSRGHQDECDDKGS